MWQRKRHPVAGTGPAGEITREHEYRRYQDRVGRQCEQSQSEPRDLAGRLVLTARIGCGLVFRRGMVRLQHAACIWSEVDVAVIVMTGGCVNAYLHGHEGGDGRSKHRDQSQTGQQMSESIDPRHLAAIPKSQTRASTSSARTGVQTKNVRPEPVQGRGFADQKA